MNDKEQIKALRHGNLLKMQRIDELFRQNEKLESGIFNYQIWVGVLTFVILLMIYAVAR